MSGRRFLGSTALLFIVALVWNGFVHLVVLRGAEEAARPLFRSDVGRWWWLSLLQTLALIAIFVLGYARLRRTGSLREALGFGLFVGLIAVLLVDVNQFVLYPLPAGLVAGWALFGLLEFLLYGLLVRWLYSVRRQGSG